MSLIRRGIDGAWLFNFSTVLRYDAVEGPVTERECARAIHVSGSRLF